MTLEPQEYWGVYSLADLNVIVIEALTMYNFIIISVTYFQTRILDLCSISVKYVTFQVQNSWNLYDSPFHSETISNAVLQ